MQKQKSWAVVEFETSSEHEDLAAWLMMHHCGASGCEIKPALAGAVLVHATFASETLSDSDMVNIQRAMEEYGLAESLRTLKTTAVIEEDWLAKWKLGFKPFAIGERFVVCPTWEADTIGDNSDFKGRRVILIEPGMAFGTGLHTTTQFCMRTLESRDLGRKVLDVGTGSGILAICCALINCELDITGVDTDPVAIEVAGTNLELNGVVDRVKLVVGSTEAVANQQYDCLLSNLTCEDIVALLPEYKKLLPTGGSVICAGILQEKLPLLEKALPGSGFDLASKELENGWAGVVLQRS